VVGQRWQVVSAAGGSSHTASTASGWSAALPRTTSGIALPKEALGAQALVKKLAEEYARERSRCRPTVWCPSVAGCTWSYSGASGQRERVWSAVGDW
jgi:hypothetical protein